MMAVRLRADEGLVVLVFFSSTTVPDITLLVSEQYYMFVALYVFHAIILTFCVNIL